MEVPHYWRSEQVQRLLDSLASHNRHQGRTAALIMWRTGLRVAEALGQRAVPLPLGRGELRWQKPRP